MSAYTPGPWVQWADTNIVIKLHSGRPQAEDLRICEVATNTWHDEGRHNARLIASAPDLLAALIVANEALCDLPLMDPRVQQIRAAIAKATGR